jgi:nitrogen fixation/metabolism regulation signal transduction histidine kinase
LGTRGRNEKFVRARDHEEYQRCPVVLDQEEIGKVLRNLVVNADEVDPRRNREIRIGTSCQDGKIASRWRTTAECRGNSGKELFNCSPPRRSPDSESVVPVRKIVEAHGGTMEWTARRKGTFYHCCRIRG